MPFDEKAIPLFDDAESLRSEPHGFTHEQMVTCNVCLRANPPTRTSCLYCATELPATELTAALRKPTLRKLEAWERGFNVIFLPAKTAHLTDEALKEVADLLRLEPADLSTIVQSSKPLPLARAANVEEASLLEARLAAIGVSVIAVADTDLVGEDSLPRRARAFELTDDELVARPAAGSAEIWRTAWNEIRMMVTGRLHIRQLEVEQRNRRKAAGEIVGARELSTDDAVLDIYFEPSARGLRVSAGNFDFSCLGQRKGLMTGQNFSTLITVLRERASRAYYDDSYTGLRHALAPVWPLEQHTEGRGWRRKGPGRVNTEAVTTSSNDLQFTRYSRLRNYLRVHHPDSTE